MIDGQTRKGRIKGFDPSFANLMIEESRVGGLARRDQLPSERIAYIAFEKGAAVPLNEVPTADLVDLRIHVAGGKVFTVSVDPAKLNEQLGFYAYPAEADSPFQEFYFYAAGVNAKEDTAMLGAMLVANGSLQVADLNRGVSNQVNERKIHIGQILLQHNKVTPEAIETAHELQSRKRLRIGEVLVELGLANEDDIDKALAEQKKRKGKRLGEVLVDLGIIREAALFQTLARKFHMPFATSTRSTSTATPRASSRRRRSRRTGSCRSTRKTARSPSPSAIRCRPTCTTSSASRVTLESAKCW